MSKLVKLVALCVSAMFIASSTLYAEVIDVSVPITIGATIGATATMTVTPRNISDNAIAAGLAFSSPGVAQWTVSDQYLNVVYNCNLPLWAIRIVTDNVSANPGMPGKPTAPGVDGVYGTPDDILSYGGLVDALTISNPDNRAPLAWQAYPGTSATGVLTDATVGGAWNSNWSYIADISNTGYDADVDGDSNVATYAYSTVVQGGASSNGLNFHPDDGVRTGDGDIAVYVGARFQGLSAGAYSAALRVQLIHD
jgi:hypothetical protein